MNPTAILQKLQALRDDLAELAFVLDSRRQPAAADVANTVSAELRELCAALQASHGGAESIRFEAGVRSPTAQTLT